MSLVSEVPELVCDLLDRLELGLNVGNPVLELVQAELAALKLSVDEVADLLVDLVVDCLFVTQSLSALSFL